MDYRENRMIEQLSTNLNLLLQGKKTQLIQTKSNLDSLNKLAEAINEISYLFSEIQEFILPLAQGRLNIKAPSAKNRLASPFKELHSQLQYLVWQVQRIADGDYTQRVDFMGDFSLALNSMVVALEEKSRLVNEQMHLLEGEAERLRESESRYSSAVRYSPGGLYIFDPRSMQILESNPQFQDMMGYSEAEMSSLTVYDFYSNYCTADEDIKHILEKSLYNISARQYCVKNGASIDVDLYSCWSTSGKLSVVIVNVQDVTERNKAQEISAKYNALVGQTRDIILFTCLDGQIVEANKAAEDAYGYTRGELLALRIYDLFNPGVDTIEERHMQQASSQGVTFETVHIRRDGTSFPVEVSSQGLLIGNELITASIIRDISDRKRMEADLRYLATHDGLTRVSNRYVLEETIAYTIAQNKQTQKAWALLLIDVDNFKFINDTLGHDVGDMVLVDLVSTLKKILRAEDLLARLGGDEFAVLLNGVSNEEARLVAEKLRSAIEGTNFSLGNCKLPIVYTISIGVASLSTGDLTLKKVLALADYALYQSKEEGRNRVFCRSTEQPDTDKLTETTDLLHLINNAIQKEQFFLVFQPIVDIFSGETLHHEALMRVMDETGKMVYPGKIIPIAERFGLMAQLDQLVIKLAFKALENYPELRVFVNLSGTSLGDEGLLDFIEENMRSRAIEPTRLCFEITETTAMKDLVRAERWIRRLKQSGCLFALDDFGVGFSSFSYLKYLSVDYVKIDGSYVREMDKDSKQRALVQAMSTVARSLCKVVIAEFVESSSILELLKEDQVSHGQGYYLCYPELVPKLGRGPAQRSE